MTLLQLEKSGDTDTNLSLNLKDHRYDKSLGREQRQQQIPDAMPNTASPASRSVPVIGADESCHDVVTLFKCNPAAPCIVITNSEGHPDGLIMRELFYKVMSGRFSREIYGERSAYVLAEPNPMITELSVPLTELLQQALQRPDHQFYDCVLLTEQGKFAGVLTVKDLLQLSAELQSEAERKRDVILQQSSRRTLEIEQGLSQVAQAAQITRQRSEEMKDWSSVGSLKLEQVRESYQGLVKGMEERAGLVTELVEKADSISSITKQITELAGHSSLLALNASIEAAHAGEHGRGFRIVAGEVQHLAKQTRQLSSDISSMLIEIGQLADEAARVTIAGIRKIRTCEDIVAEGYQMFVQLGDSVQEVGEAGSRTGQFSREAAERIIQIRQELEEMNG